MHAAARESQADVAPWLPALHADLTLDGVRAFIAGSAAERASGRVYDFVIADARTDEFLGGCGLTSTLLTLLIVPTAYSLLESATQRLRGLRRTRATGERRRPTVDTDAPPTAAAS